MQFQPGISGNEKGRPKGTGARQKVFNELVSPYADEIIKKSIELALSGNEPLLKFFLDRLLPRSVIYENIDLVGTPQEKIEILLHLIVSGHVSPDEACKIANVIEKEVGLVNIEEFANRLKVMEEYIKGRAISPTRQG